MATRTSPLSNVKAPRRTFTLGSWLRHLWKSFWRLRYRFYALIVLIALLPFLYAGSRNIPQQVQVFGFDTLYSNALFSTVERAERGGLTLGERTVLVAEKFNYFDQSDGFGQQDNSYLFSQVGLSAEEQIKLAKAAPLGQVLECPRNPQQRNFLRYPQYNINTPIIYSELTDLFQTNPDGSINYSAPVEEDLSQGPLSNPIQRLLVDGIVHIAFTAKPGEIGNSYIVGHSSNFSSVRSDYNTIFKPIERISQPGEEFIIWDECGRELNFRVFETKAILEDDVEEAYKIFGDKRVVTLQTSILEFVPGVGLYPTKRWLTRGELILE